jgi:hypothetical protein
MKGGQVEFDTRGQFTTSDGRARRADDRVAEFAN